MDSSRMEAFSDGVIAVAITIMVLDLKVPHHDAWADLFEQWPVFVSYVLSFVNIGIYWNNHHHMLHAVQKVNGRVLWANLHLLFWLSLMPLLTGWMGENHFTAVPVTAYAFDLMMCAIAYTILQQSIIALHGNESVLAEAVGSDTKGKISLASYAASIPLAWAGYPLLAGALIIVVACLWLIPDRRIENKINHG